VQLIGYFTMVKSNSSSAITYAKNARKAFLFFCNEHKATIRQATGLGKGRDGRKALDNKVFEAWKHLPQEHRAKYDQMAREDKLRFQAEVASGLPVKQVAKKPKATAIAPKKAMSPFLFFSEAERPRVMEEAAAAGEELKLADIAKRLGKMWKQLTEEEKKPYYIQGEAAKAQYKEDVEAYLGRQQPVKAKKAAARDADLPKKFVGAYMRFMSANRTRVKAASAVPLNAKDLSRALATEWKALSAEQKQPFEEAAAGDSARFREEMQAYRIRKHEEQRQAKAAKASKPRRSGATTSWVKKHAKA
jgi:hypothetical protein